MLKNWIRFFLIVPLCLFSCKGTQYKAIQVTKLHDKIAGGWAGKMIGLSYGTSTEFRACGKIYNVPLKWQADMIKNSLSQVDLYVQMSFMMTMDKYGIYAPVDKFFESFANAGYQLWRANLQSRKNYFDGIMPPLSGNPLNNIWADAIDFQIEADYIGFMCPGMPQTSNAICDKIGHIMNYGDGVYGGMFVCAMYTQAYFNQDILSIVKQALLSIPAGSDYAKCIRDVIGLYLKYPDNWQNAWKDFEQKWSQTDISGPLDPLNNDAKINGAYIVMGLLYGHGDFDKTMEITIRCGQDSDCNPSNAAAVLGIRNGYSGIPDEWKSAIPLIADSNFIYTDYSFNKVVNNTLKYVRQNVLDNGGKIIGDVLHINLQTPTPPDSLEISFPNIRPVSISTVGDSGWSKSGIWDEIKNSVNQTCTWKSKSPNSTSVFEFYGTGIALKGNWGNDSGLAQIYIDGKPEKIIDTWYFVNKSAHSNIFLYHHLKLPLGKHSVQVQVLGNKNLQSLDSYIYLNQAIVYSTVTSD